MNTMTHNVHSNGCATLRAKSNTPTTCVVSVPLAAIQAAAHAVRIRGDTALHTSDSASKVHNNALHQQCNMQHQISNAASQYDLKVTAGAGNHAGRQHAFGQPRSWDCMSASADDDSAAAGAQANAAAATQPRSVSRYINRTAAKITTQPSTSTAEVDQSVNPDWIRIERRQ